MSQRYPGGGVLGLGQVGEEVGGLFFWGGGEVGEVAGTKSTGRFLSLTLALSKLDCLQRLLSLTILFVTATFIWLDMKQVWVQLPP